MREKMTKRIDIIQAYLDRGLTPEAAILQFKKDRPEYQTRHFDKNGTPLTFEAAVSRNMRKFGMTAGEAITAANKQDWRLYKDYQFRLENGIACDLEYVKKGGILI
jgi:hypothetical protein